MGQPLEAEGAALPPHSRVCVRVELRRCAADRARRFIWWRKRLLPACRLPRVGHLRYRPTIVGQSAYDVPGLPRSRLSNRKSEPANERVSSRVFLDFGREQRHDLTCSG